MISEITKEKLWMVLTAVLLIILAVFIYLYFIRQPEPKKILGKPVPAFSAPELYHPYTPFTDATLDHKVDLIIFWNSSCQACMEEHDLLMYIASTHLVTLYGIDFKDNSKAAKAYLHKNGNPYKAIAVDSKGRIGLLINLQRVPEVFVIDKNGVIRDDIAGPVTPVIWFNHLVPEINKLNKEKPHN